MDCVSNQVEFRFTLGSSRGPDQAMLTTRNLSVLAYVEGQLIILVNGSRVFEEPQVLLLELGTALLGWMHRIRNGDVNDFEYVSMDYDDGPLLRFTREAEHKWLLQSPWIETTSAIRLDESALVTAVDSFLRILESQLHRCYGIALSEYLT